MASEHISERLLAYLDGRLDPSQREELARHLAGCPACAEEHDALRAGRSLLAPLSEIEARPGFAARVALHAADAHARPFGAPWWRWAFGGFAGAAAAAALVVAVLPRGGGPQVPVSPELLLAQRLDLYEDISVMQNREALENLDVVEELDRLGPEVGTP